MKGPVARLSEWHAKKAARKSAEITRAQPLDNGIGAEAPIHTAQQDRLRRTGFAERIATVLSELSLREGRIFAIRGGWGFGKSSLKNLITERLDARNDGAEWFDFNPWQWGDGDAIARALFGQIADRLGGEHSKAALARADALRRYGAILTGASAPLKKAGNSSYLITTVLTNASVIAIAAAIGFDLPTAAKVATVLAVLSIGASLGGRVMTHLGKDRSAEPLEKVRTSLEARLRELGRPLVVFVDDIDRLEPEYIRVLLRQVKANANLPNIVFVLLFQPSIVESALDPVADGDGRAFLEKIVQANFDLPAVPVSIVHETFGKDLSALAVPYATAANGFSATRWGNAFVGYIQPFLRNIRDARRLISSIAVHIPLHAAGKVFEVNIIDFLILETLRVFEPDLHSALFRNRILLLQEQRNIANDRDTAIKEQAAELLEVTSVQHRDVAKDALKDLFPMIEWAFGGTYYTNNYHNQWLAEKRVCSPRYFPRYFELQTAAGEISERDFVAFVEATSDKALLAALVAEIKTRDLMNSLAARLDESRDILPGENAAVLLPAMFEIAQSLVGECSGDPFNTPWVFAWRATSWYLKRIPRDVRGNLAAEALRSTGALSVGAILINLNDPTSQEDNKRETFDPALELVTVDAMKTEWLRLIRERSADISRMITDPDLMSQLYNWRAYASEDEPRKWVAEATSTDEGFAAFSSRMMNRGIRSSAGDRVSTPYHSFQRETVESFIGIDKAKAKCDAIDPTIFPEHEDALRTLLRYLEVWLGLRDYDRFDF
ncbi:KAP family P-loop domain-containing protein [Neokomagataea thailandica NBRC 106555]|uniref:NTPase n=2 Tax=Neokomagataea TaxID=1223423 RepID=A0A4Y6VAD8_9PROT|nr:MULTISPECIES: P-loop NTPase fold protein [Neokomagataea]QDH25660.1 NTPase [Neokomagataea tanensis]GBR55364.1 KAP family P-loop domain-containing protein [Neokomagataea thailandica NBRC 106555]